MSPQQREVQKLFVTNVSAIRGFILSVLPNRDDTDDILHEVYLVVMDKADNFELGTKFLSWVFTISRFTIMDQVKRRSNRRIVPLGQDVIELLAEAAPDQAYSDDYIKALHHCVDALAPAAKRVIKLRYNEGQKPSRIAEDLGLSPATVYVSLSKARALLKQCVSKRLRLGEAR
ncbi:MAG: sigma-70 family RNA polymerase sigma factor [Planctomycetota bacterium]